LRCPATTLGSPLVSLGVAGCMGRSIGASEVCSPQILGTPRHWAESPLHRDGVIGFRHKRKISSILIRNTVVPIATRTALGSCLAI
jgi:hypothetical protein